MWNRRNNRSRAGFTLTEVLLSCLLGAFLVVLTLGVFQTMMRHRRAAMYYSESAAQSRYITNALHRDLSNLYRSRNNEDFKLEGTTIQNNGRRLDQVRLFTLNDMMPSPDGMGEVVDVAYELQSIPDQSLMSLYRHREAVRNSLENNAADSIHLSRRIRKFDLQYYDGKTWRDRWRSEDGAPIRVRFRLVLGDVTGEFPDQETIQEMALTPWQPRAKPGTVSQISSLVNWGED